MSDVPGLKEALNKAQTELLESILKLKSIIAYTEEFNKNILTTDISILRAELGKKRKVIDEKKIEADKLLKTKEPVEHLRLELNELVAEATKLDGEISSVKETQIKYQNNKKNLAEHTFHYRFVTKNEDKIGNDLENILGLQSHDWVAVMNKTLTDAKKGLGEIEDK